MVRIAHIITGLQTGGAETMLHKLLSRMDRGRFDSVVVSLTDHRGSTIPIPELGIPVSSCAHGGMLRVIRELRGFRPHLLQGWMYHGNLAAQAMAAALPERPAVLWNIRGTHENLSAEKLTTAATIWIGGKFSTLPQRIISNSTVSARVHQQKLGYRRDGWVVIPNGFDLERFRPSEKARAEVRAELGLPDGTLLIGVIGRYHPLKDHANFLSAAAILRKTVPEAHFLLVGSGVDQSTALREQATRSGLSNCVRMLGERADMPRLTAALDIASSSSNSEAFPNVIGEAMSCEVPCAVTDVGDSAWLVSETGRNAPARNPEALAKAWEELCSLGATGRKTLGAAARNRIGTHFSIASVAQQYEQLYEQVLEPHMNQRGYRPCAA